MRGRRIIHVDMDAFFASVEQVRNPALRGKPLIIGGDVNSLRGVVSTASYEARAFGVRSAMPLVQAKRLCPNGIFMKGNYHNYHEASLEIRTVLETVSPQVEFASIDEAYMDVTGSQKLFGGDDGIAAYIKSRIREETGLPCTIAIAPNKLVAKIASERAKPDGYLRIAEGEEAAFLRPLPIRKLPGVGPRTCETLEAMGIMTIGALAELPQITLLDTFGQSGLAMQRAAKGISTSEVDPGSLSKSISRETTFEKDLRDWNYIEQMLIYLAERAAYALRESGAESRCVSLKVRYSDFKTNTFARTLAEPTCVDYEIIRVLQSLLPKAKERRAPVRLVGVALTSLVHDQRQLHLFGASTQDKWERALEGVDRIRTKHGFECIRTAKSMGMGRHVNLATPSLSR